MAAIHRQSPLYSPIREETTMILPNYRISSSSNTERLIPSLPDEIAVECLVRIPNEYHSTMKLVCHKWQSLFSNPSFFTDRRRVGTAEHLIFLVQPLPSTPTTTTTDLSPLTEATAEQFSSTEKSQVAVRSSIHGPPQYSLGIYNLTRNKWNRLAMTESDSDNQQIRIPMFCQAVSVSPGKVILIGGWDPDTLEPVSEVYVINLQTGKWKRGAPMKTARSFFACAVVGSGTVWVAGGHDGQKNALRSAEVYDVEKDEWRSVTDMWEERDECYGVESDGRFWVVSGYGTESQGRFRTDGEWYDEGRGEWVRVEGVWEGGGVGPRGTVVGSGADGRRRWWCLSGGEGEVKEFDWVEKRWRVFDSGKVRVPGGLRGGESGGGLSLCAVDLGEKWFVMGGGGGGEGGDGVYVVEKEGNVWRPVNEVPVGFQGFPFSAAHLLI